MEIHQLYKDHKEIVLYALFGALTTASNILVYWFMARLVRTDTMVSAVVAWAVAVLFAYVTNRKWVFYSGASAKSGIAKELISFFACRLATGMVDWGLMLICVDFLLWNDMAVKIVANIIVIVLNYFFSKIVIFREGRM